MTSYQDQKSFQGCDFNERLLYTAFLFLVGAGYLMALIYLYTNFQGIDGKPGLSVEDVAENYYGNRSGTRLEAALRGPMASFVSFDQRHEVVAWLKSGAERDTYEKTIKPIFEQQCLSCHGDAKMGMGGHMGGVVLTDYAAVRKVANVDMGVSLHTLMRVSHIHLFGIGLILLSVGMIFRRVMMRGWLKATLILLPFFAVFIDIAAWFLTKWDPMYAYTVVLAGALMGVSLTVQILISLYQMWWGQKESE